MNDPPFLELFDCVNSSFSADIKGMSFNRFGLSPGVVRGTQAMGFVEPTPIRFPLFPINSGWTRQCLEITQFSMP